MTLHYLSFCGAPGLARMRKILLHVAYLDPALSTSQRAKGKGKANPVGESEAKDEFVETTVEDVLRACYDYGLDDVASQICRVSAPGSLKPALV